MKPQQANGKQELETLFREIEDISEDLSAYFEYCEARQLPLRDLLTRSSLN